MRAMILAAGLGTRLRPLTDDRPKALVELAGRTLLEITLTRLRAFGITEVIINVHHFADQVIAYLNSNNNFGRMLQFLSENPALATLPVQSRETSRPLLFDDHHQLRGRRAGGTANPGCAPQMTATGHPSGTASAPKEPYQSLAFSGIHVISPRLLPLLTEEGVFSIIPAYLRLAAQGQKILAFRADQYYWRDLGKPADLTQAALDLQKNAFL